ncbi:hypothetical protein [Raoultella terrigena]|uniref:hypothetical protein n=1 Tax=Raoultella terrigena TaxID=577 RepID=UPI003BF4A7CF
MRFYEINIFNEKNEVIKNYSSHKNGVYNPGALMVEFDIQQVCLSTPAGESRLTIWGISPADMQQARMNYNNKRIQIFAGMAAGLPLAGKHSKGLVIEGVVNQAYGNWQGTELRLDFIIYSGPANTDKYGAVSSEKITFPWSVGQKLSVALAQCIMRMGGYKPNINISDLLVLNFERPMFCDSITLLAKDLKTYSRSVIKDPGYSGVEMAVNQSEIRVWDNDYKNHPSGVSERKSKPLQIEFTDLIGQPTWISFGVVSLFCVMRADIHTGDHILMPKNSRPVIQASSFSQYRDESAFQGQFEVQSVRFLGNSRQPTADSWVTIIEAHPAMELKAK